MADTDCRYNENAFSPDPHDYCFTHQEWHGEHEAVGDMNQVLLQDTAERLGLIQSPEVQL